MVCRNTSGAVNAGEAFHRLNHLFDASLPSRPNLDEIHMPPPANNKNNHRNCQKMANRNIVEL